MLQLLSFGFVGTFLSFLKELQLVPNEISGSCSVTPGCFFIFMFQTCFEVAYIFKLLQKPFELMVHQSTTIIETSFVTAAKM